MRPMAAQFARDTLQVAVVGDISAERLGKLLDSVFRRAACQGAAHARRRSGAEAWRAGQRRHGDPADGQSLWAPPATSAPTPDFIPAFVMNHILGGWVFLVVAL